MKNKIFIIIGLLLLIKVGAENLNAQENCAQNLKKAQELYNTGQIESISALLEPCIESGFTREEKVQAYKLLINAYIFDDNMGRADTAMLRFLRLYPEYAPISTDPSEFVNLMMEFDNRPRFSVGILIGGTYSVIRAFEPVNSSPQKGNYGDYNTSGVSYHVNLTYVKNINSNIELAIEGAFKSTVFDHYLDPNSFTSNSYFESQITLGLPVSAIYTFNTGKYEPYVRLGVNPSYLVSSGADLMTDPGEESPRISNLDNRQKIGVSGIIGGGVKFKISKAYLFLDVRYNLSMTNQVNNIGRRNTQADELWLYQTRDDSFYHDDLNFSLGFVRTLYNPRKKK